MIRMPPAARPERRLRIAFVASEVEPWFKTGGLADVVDALARALGRAGHAVDVFLPAYRHVRRPPGLERSALAVPVADPGRHDEGDVASVDILAARADGYRLRLVEHPFSFDREGAYGKGGADYADNGFRFALFCRAALEAVRADGRPLDVLHAHDWQGALAVVYRDALYGSDPVVGPAATVLTIHNLAYHGWVPRERRGPLMLPEETYGDAFGVDLLREGIRAADLVTTVSPTYAREALTPESGMGLDGDLRARGDRFVGIMNGLDTELWDPATDAALPVRYALVADPGRGVAEVAAGKAAAKADLVDRHGLDLATEAPLLGLVGRLDPQKGFDLLTAAAPAILGSGARLVVLGSGHAELVAGLRALAAARPGRIAVVERFDRDEARRIYAGSDLFLMPSRFEPSGQGQLIAFRYGTPVIARRTGGLADSVADADADPERGNGFVFDAASPEAFAAATRRALAWWAEADRWSRLRARVMALDHSWAVPARAYLDAYRGAMALRR